MRRLSLAWRTTAQRGARCALDIPAPPPVELYAVQVAFEYLQDPAERAWFRNLPTSFQLPRDSVDKLRAVARRLLAEDPEFRKLMKALDGK